MINKLVIDSEKMKLVLISTVYKDNNGAIFEGTSPSMTPTSKSHFCQVSLVQSAHWKGICDSED